APARPKEPSREHFIRQCRAMNLVMTLLVRNEADIVRDNIDFHLSQGVDFVIATDNGSDDDTPKLLRTYEEAGVLRLIHEPEHTHSQGLWVTRMARMAFSDHQADRVINNDPDQSRWP